MKGMDSFLSAKCKWWNQFNSLINVSAVGYDFMSISLPCRFHYFFTGAESKSALNISWEGLWPLTALNARKKLNPSSKISSVYFSGVHYNHGRQEVGAGGTGSYHFWKWRGLLSSHTHFFQDINEKKLAHVWFHSWQYSWFNEIKHENGCNSHLMDWNRRNMPQVTPRINWSANLSRDPKWALIPCF